MGKRYENIYYFSLFYKINEDVKEKEDIKNACKILNQGLL